MESKSYGKAVCILTFRASSYPLHLAINPIVDQACSHLHEEREAVFYQGSPDAIIPRPLPRYQLLLFSGRPAEQLDFPQHVLISIKTMHQLSQSQGYSEGTAENQLFFISHSILSRNTV